MFSSYTSVQREEVFMRNSATIKVIGEGTIQFQSHDGCITTVQGGEVFMRNSATNKVITEGIIQFQSHDGCITTLQSVRYVPGSRHNSSLLEPYMEKASISVLKVILWRFLKMPM